VMKVTETENQIDVMIWELLAARRKKGRKTYKKGLEYNDSKYKDRWLDMAIEETIDALQYLLAEKLRRGTPP